MISSFVRALVSAFKAHRKLALENVALRQQLAVLRRSVKRTRLSNVDRVLCQNSALLKDHGCNLMHRKVLASFYQHLMAEAPMRSV